MAIKPTNMIESDQSTTSAVPTDVEVPTDAATATGQATANPESDNIVKDLGDLYHELSARFDELRATCEQIRDTVVSRVYDLDTKEGYELLRCDYKRWLSVYESYLDCDSKYSRSLEEQDMDNYHIIVQKDRDSFCVNSKLKHRCC